MGEHIADNLPGILLVGGGGHALVVAEAALAAGRRLVGFLDDSADARLKTVTKRVGGLALLDNEDISRRHEIILAVGDLRLRAALLPRLRGAVATVVHPRAFVSPSATIGQGAFVAPGAVVHSRASVGEHCTVNSGAIVEHDVTLGANSHAAPGAALGGEVAVGEGTLIGLGARVLPGVRVGRGCVVGAGAVVIQDTADGVCLVGVPAREVG